MKKLLLLSLLIVSALGAQAQTYDLKSDTYLLTSDTVVNTAAVNLTSPEISGSKQLMAFQVEVTEISGTTAGTLKLQGSIDGSDFKDLPTVETQTAIATAAPADVTTKQVFIWRLNSNHFRYYRVVYTGAGTMSARFFAQLMLR